MVWIKYISKALQFLLYLVYRVNIEQTFFSAVSIGRERHISISMVVRAMRELVETGYVKKESLFREGNKRQTSNLYALEGCVLSERGRGQSDTSWNDKFK